ncbi:ribonuclease domain-containing protein [Rhodanobacter lindaniclasticus]
MRRFQPLLLLLIAIVAVTVWQHRGGAPDTAVGTIDRTVATHAATAGDSLAALPPQARAMVQRITSGGPFEHSQDGAVFGNHEGLLPKQPRGYYHEYTVETPGARNRGARRIVTGGTPPSVWYYTDDHYRSFRRFEVAR